MAWEEGAVRLTFSVTGPSYVRLCLKSTLFSPEELRKEKSKVEGTAPDTEPPGSLGGVGAGTDEIDLSS